MAYPRDYVPKPLQPTPRTAFGDFPRPASIDPPRPASAAAMRVKLAAQAFTAREAEVITEALTYAAAELPDREFAAEVCGPLGIFAAVGRYYELQRERDRKRYGTPPQTDREFVEEPQSPADMVGGPCDACDVPADECVHKQRPAACDLAKAQDSAPLAPIGSQCPHDQERCISESCDGCLILEEAESYSATT